MHNLSHAFVISKHQNHEKDCAILYHCIVLQKLDGGDEDCHDNVSQISQSDWSTLTMRNSVDLALHVYESIELELNLVSSESPQVSGLSIELV